MAFIDTFAELARQLSGSIKAGFRQRIIHRCLAELTTVYSKKPKYKRPTARTSGIASHNVPATRWLEPHVRQYH